MADLSRDQRERERERARDIRDLREELYVIALHTLPRLRQRLRLRLGLGCAIKPNIDCISQFYIVIAEH